LVKNGKNAEMVKQIKVFICNKALTTQFIGELEHNIYLNYE